MYARVWRALSDTSENASAAALLDLSRYITSKGVPVVLLDASGTPTDDVNVPLDNPTPRRAPRLRGACSTARTRRSCSRVGNTVHFGNTLLVRGLRIVPIVQATLIVLLGLAGLYAVRARGRAERERIWAGMARESAHQLGTPLSSLSGWVELLSEHDADPLVREARRCTSAAISSDWSASRTASSASARRPRRGDRWSSARWPIGW